MLRKLITFQVVAQMNLCVLCHTDAGALTPPHLTNHLQMTLHDPTIDKCESAAHLSAALNSDRSQQQGTLESPEPLLIYCSQSELSLVDLRNQKTAAKLRHVRNRKVDQ